MVGNTSAVTVRATLTFNQTALGFDVKPEGMRDPLTNVSLKPTERGWSLDLEPEAARWLWLEASP